MWFIVWISSDFLVNGRAEAAKTFGESRETFGVANEQMTTRSQQPMYFVDQTPAYLIVKIDHKTSSHLS